jgi:Zn-dependent peptidase ImmA (M78 family)
MIMAHELGHFLFYNSQNTAYAYMEKGSRLPSDVDPERQADIFAAELLIPLHLIGDKNVYQVQKHFGVSRSAARAKMMHATKVRKRHEHKTHIKEKRPSPEQLNR